MRYQREKSTDGIEERTLLLRRVSKKTSGGNYATYSALVAVGDRNGRVGVGLGRGLEVPQSLRKATAYARKHMLTVPRYGTTIPHILTYKYKSAKLLLKPAPDGTGLKVGGVVRVLFDLAGIYNASGKLIGSRNQIMNAYAVMGALASLKPRVKKDTNPKIQTSSNIQTPSEEKKEEAKAVEKPKKTRAKKAEKSVSNS